MPNDQIIAYQIGKEPPLIRKSTQRRAWMDQLPERFGYRCLPLVIANQFGWDLLTPATFTATWNGGAERSDVRIEGLDGRWVDLVRSHFGSGILTFGVGYVFRTPPEIGLLACGPPNWPADGIQPLSGVVETDWNPSTFTMNYLFTRADHSVVFEAGTPYCRIIPVDRHLVERLEPELQMLSEDPVLEQRYREWDTQRTQFIAEARIQFSEAQERKWQKHYFQGVQALGPPATDHQTQLHHREFVAHKRIKPHLGYETPIQASPRRQDALQSADYSVVAAAALLRELTERQRVQVLEQFCRGCGREDPHCPCNAAGTDERG
jgi:uncharacterized protein DUF6065